MGPPELVRSAERKATRVARSTLSSLRREKREEARRRRMRLGASATKWRQSFPTVEGDLGVDKVEVAREGVSEHSYNTEQAPGWGKRRRCSSARSAATGEVSHSKARDTEQAPS
ncbi:Os03g0424066 [Oryza sativa Japonica Group]|uniref:Uncharacterized protein n=3 Tax=Oryza TaxID=4527 RepID=A0A8J8YLP8_ORYSJ|nr:hypothetical protein OsJ_11329 [Oryza sativa Japonica Group]BAS84764.1 Os03g0424066 [Oryza sativa Japonica Group]